METIFLLHNWFKSFGDVMGWVADLWNLPSSEILSGSVCYQCRGTPTPGSWPGVGCGNHSDAGV